MNWRIGPVCLPFTHKWETTRVYFSKTFESTTPKENEVPIKNYRVFEQKCTKCGLERVRQFRLR